MKLRVVHAYGCNELEIREAMTTFKRYGITVRALPQPLSKEEAEQLLLREHDREKTIGILAFAGPATLQSTFLCEGIVQTKAYALGTTGGHLGWVELLSSKFIADRLYYARRKDLNFNAQNLRRTIDFSHDPADFLLTNPLLNNPVSKEFGCRKLFQSVVNRGVFLRSPKNRREKNYWSPGLNAGIPLVPKRDEVHEITFMAHDLGHFMIPDLIFDGQHTEFNRRLYIVYRMMSEAFTLVLTDMVFVDTLRRWGLGYDYNKRKIYPLFESFSIDLRDKKRFLDHLKTLLSAGVTYCLRGSDEGFRGLIPESRWAQGEKALEAFRGKYMPFFVEDFIWTEKNYRFFYEHRDEFKHWWSQVKWLRDRAGIELETVQEFAPQLDPSAGDLINQVFEVLYARIAAVYRDPPETMLPFSRRLEKAFHRYLMGQCMLFTRYRWAAPEIIPIKKRLFALLEQSQGPFSLANVVTMRDHLREVVEHLQKRQIISKDDAETFHEVFPIFEPEYAHYDEDKSFYRDLADESDRILTLATA